MMRIKCSTICSRFKNTINKKILGKKICTQSTLYHSSFQKDAVNGNDIAQNFWKSIRKAHFVGFSDNNIAGGSWTIAALGLCCVGFALKGDIVSAEATGKKKNDSSEKELSISEVSKKLKEILEPFRSKQETYGINFPKIRIGLESPNSKTLSVKFELPPLADTAHVLASFVQTMEKKNGYKEKELILDSSVGSTKNDLCLSFIFNDYSGSILIRGKKSGRKELIVYKEKGFTDLEVEGIAEAYMSAFSNMPTLRGAISFPGRVKENDPIQNSGSETNGLEALRNLGIQVYDTTDDANKSLNWDSLAGYDDIKQEIEDTIVLALQNPEIYESIAKETRCRYESNRPRAVLFEGPPGTGKTLTARIIAQQAGVPMIHIPIEGVVSKWYGESEKKMSAIFDACGKLDGAIIFIDEIDALASDRSAGSMHEASRRMLSVLLQKLEGFQSTRKTTLICATNRKQDLDSALISRFALSIKFDLPNEKTRSAVYKRYAKHLKADELGALAEISNGMSCRDIKEICEHTERKWASRVLRKETTQQLPPLPFYQKATRYRLESMQLSRETLIEA